MANENNVIQWNGTKWIFADDNQGADEINGNQLSNNINLTSDHLNISNGELNKSHLRNFPNHYLKIDPSGQIVMRPVQIGGNIVTNLVNGEDVSALKQSFDNFIGAQGGTMELEENTPIDSNGSSKKFLTYVESGNFLQRQFVELSFDDVVSSGGSQLFYPKSIYGTPLTGYTSRSDNFVPDPTDPYKLDSDDTVLDAMVKLQKGIEFSAGLSTSYLVEDNVVNENEAERILKSKYALEVSDIGNTYVSSYSVFSLPTTLDLINDGWYVTIKAENASVYIYPSHRGDISLLPTIDDKNYYVILPYSNSFVTLKRKRILVYYELHQATMFLMHLRMMNLFIVQGMVSVSGSYLLETDGFCIDKESTRINDKNISIEENINLKNASCFSRALEAGGGEAGVATLSQWMTLFTRNVSYYENYLGIVPGTLPNNIFNNTIIHGSFKVSQGNQIKIQRSSSNSVGYELLQGNFENNLIPNDCTDSNSSELFHATRAPSQNFFNSSLVV